jgi:hypothetical protein
MLLTVTSFGCIEIDSLTSLISVMEVMEVLLLVGIEYMRAYPVIFQALVCVLCGKIVSNSVTCAN